MITKAFGGKGLLQFAMIAAPFAYVAASAGAFFGANPVEARLIYITLFFVAFSVPLITRQEKHVPLAYILMVISWAVLFFLSSQIIVFQHNALPVKRFDQYLELYRAAKRITIWDVYSLYFEYHLMAYLVSYICRWNYPATIACYFSFNTFLLFLLSALYFRALRQVTSFRVAYAFSSALILFSFSSISVWIFDDKYHGVVLFLLFIYLIAHMKPYFEKRKTQIALWLLDIGISVSSLMASLNLILLSLVLSITKKNWKEAYFSLPPLVYTLYITWDYLSKYVSDLFDVLYEWVKILEGEANLGRAGFHPEATPIYDTIGNYVFYSSYLIVLGIIWLYLFFLFLQKAKRSRVTPEIQAICSMYLVLSLLAVGSLIACRVSTRPSMFMNDMGNISFQFAEMTLPVTIIPVTLFVQKALLKSKKTPWNSLTKLFALFLLLMVIVSCAKYVYKVYPKSVKDPILGPGDWDDRHENQIYGVYSFIVAYKDHANYTCIMTPVAVLVYEQRLQLQGIYTLYFQYEEFFSSSVRLIERNDLHEGMLVCYPKYSTFREIAGVSNKIYDNGPQIIGSS